MITLCDFDPFLANQLAMFLKGNVIINFFPFQGSVCLSKKPPVLLPMCFLKKYIFNHNIGPRTNERS
jgi:hypothetical protein